MMHFEAPDFLETMHHHPNGDHAEIYGHDHRVERTVIHHPRYLAGRWYAKILCCFLREEDRIPTMASSQGGEFSR